MNLYLWLNILIILFPLLLSFDKKVAFYRRWPAVLPAIGVVGVLYIVWDVFMSVRGSWGFNPRYAGGFRLFHLPAGEMLFFLTAPYSCLFIYEVVRSYFKESALHVPRVVWWALAVVCTAAALYFRSQTYTCTVLLSVALLFVLADILRGDLLQSRHFWLFLALSYLPFVLFNGLLTALPVVVYDAGAIWGIRVYTIPLEDFLYSLSLLGFNALVYRLFVDRGRAGSSARGPGSQVRRSGSSGSSDGAGTEAGRG